MRAEPGTELSPDQLTELLNAWSHGDPAASDVLVRTVFHDLRRLARAHMAGERSDHTFQPTALVNEVFLRLSDQPGTEWRDREHFFAACTRLMRRVLVDHARKHRAVKRGAGAAPLPLDVLDQQPTPSGLPSDELLALDQALTELGLRHSRQAQVVELRFFLGLTIEEVAQLLGSAPRTIKKDWTQARAWLYRSLHR